jgi:hypothetical protein
MATASYHGFPPLNVGISAIHLRITGQPLADIVKPTE